MIRRERQAQKKFHGKDGDLVSYHVEVKYYLCGWCWRRLIDNEECTEEIGKGRVVGFK